jgi:hypothetical protein
MRPRDFCREPGYDKALLITYDFDALFFERIVLPDLWVGGSTDIQVLADLGQVTQALPRWVGQVRQLGQRYQLICATVPGAFHPKIIIRSGSSGGAVWIGSGNVTHGGWGCNLEVGSAWRLGPGEGDNGGWVRDLLSHIVTWLPAVVGDSVHRRILDSPWLGTTNDGSTQIPVIVAQKGLTLAQQVSERWRGRRFEQATIVTGSSDERGSVLRWFHDQFGVSRATVLVDPTMASFKSEELNRLPVDVNLVAPKVPRTVHAKFYWLDGPDGPAAIMGSANCSRSAWLLSPDSGGNVEAVAIYDQPLREDFADLLRCVAIDETIPTNIIDAPENEGKDAAPGPEYPVAAVSWERSIREIKLVFTKPLPAGSSVAIQIEDERVPCHYHDANTLWWAHLAVDSFGGRGTVFADVVIRTADGRDLPPQHVFITDLAELRNAARGRGMADSVKNLGRPHSTSEYQQILLELQRIGIALLNDDSLFPDPLSVRKEVKKQAPAKDQDSAPAVDPEQLIRSLDAVGSSQNGARTASPLQGLTLNGIMRALFDLEDDDPEITEGDAEYEDPADPTAPNNPPAPPSPPTPPHPPKTQAPPNTTKAKLRKEMDGFIKSLGDPKFAAKCSASQLQQAAAYPLAVGANGLVGGWIDAAVGQDWTTRVFDTLFCARFAGASDGLIEAVKRRYEARGEGEAFRNIIGDGTLWAAMLASLRKMVWNGRNGEIKKALALRAVLLSRDLLASAEPGRMAALISNVERRSRMEGLLTVAKDATRVLTDLEHYIVQHWDQLMAEQSQAGPPREPDDALFNHNGGWAFFVRETEPLEAAKIIVYLQRKATEVKVSVTAVQYLNVTKATRVRPDLRAIIDSLKNI